MNGPDAAPPPYDTTTLADELADEAQTYLAHLRGEHPDWDSGLIAWTDPDETP